MEADQRGGRGMNHHAQEANLPSVLWEDLELIEADDTLRDLVFASLRSGSLGPLVREELRCSIQSRRLAQGQEEMQISFDTPASDQLRPEEVERQDRRRTQNRQAAQRFRQRQRERAEHLTQEMTRLEAENAELKQKIQQLTSEKARLTSRLLQHAARCRLQPHRPSHQTAVSSPL